MLRTTNVDEINQIEIIPNVIRRRLQKECKEVQNNYDEISVEYSQESKILVTFIKRGDTYIFTIPKNYPFESPKMMINGIDQNKLFNLRTKRFITILKYVSGFDCLCCNSYLCRNNWSPAVTLNRVINQIEAYKNYKYFIFLKLISDKIKEKYLNIDIDLDSWLFTVCSPRECYAGDPIH